MSCCQHDDFFNEQSMEFFNTNILSSIFYEERTNHVLIKNCGLKLIDDFYKSLKVRGGLMNVRFLEREVIKVFFVFKTLREQFFYRYISQ